VGAVFIAGLAALAMASPARADTWQVTGTGDASTGCNPDTHNCPSLRAAIAASEATKEEPDVINVPPGEIDINNDLVIQSDITVNGANARTTIIDGNFKYRGFRITSTGSAKINHLTIRNGAAGQGGSPDGGGVLNFSGVVQLNTVRVTASTAPEGSGGGIANYQGTLTLVNGLVDNNTAGDGAGIANLGGAETPDRGLLGVATTTIFKNTAGIGGTGGISSRGGQANIVLFNFSTLADNVGGVRGVGGLLIQSGAAQAIGDLIARNTVAGEGLVNCGPVKPTDSGGNLEDDKDCIDAGGGLNPGLATALRNEGGELDVLPIGASSPAVDRNTASCTAPDARSLYRPQGPACDSGAYELDKAATVTITEGPNGPITVNDVEFRFQASEPGPTVQCQLTGPGQSPGFVECYKSNAQPYADLADGPYTFSVRAADAAFPTPPVTTRAFIVNTAPPNTTITSGPSGPFNSTSAAFTYTSSEVGSTFQCSLDGAAFGTCPPSYTGLSQGSHSFRVRAIDAAGTIDPTPDLRTWTVDTADPDTTINTGPSAPTKVNPPVFTFSSSEGSSTFECRVDTGTFMDCTSPHTTASLTQGPHTFEVRAIDSAGNVDETPASRSFTVDTVAPAAPVVSSPVNNALLMTNTVAFNGTAEPGTTVELREGATLTGSAVASGTGNWTIVMGAVPDGPHTYAARAIDTATNASAPTNRTVTVDTALPDTAITGGPNGPISDATPTFTFSSEAGATFECSIDAGAHTACPNPFTTPTLNQGPHTLSVRAVDPAGNRDNTPATRNFYVDTVAPETTINTGPSNPTNNTAPQVSFSANEPDATFECRLDSPSATGTYQSCTSPRTLSTTAQGSYTLLVRATDLASNTDQTPASRTWTVDTLAPPAPAISAPANGAILGSQTFTLSGTAEANATVEVFEGTTSRGTATATAGGAWSRQLTSVPEGSHTYTATARDAAGNVSGPSAARTITIDTGPPDPPAITAGPNGPVKTASVEFTFTGEQGATFECVLDNGDPVNCTSPKSYSGLAEGSHIFGVRQIDAAGNGSDTTTREFSVDLTPPAAPAVVSGPEGATTDPSPAFAFSSETGTFVECRLDGPSGSGSFQQCASPLNFSGLAPGDYTLFIRSTDAAGNERTTQRSFTITQVVAAQTPTPTPTPAATPAPTPVPQQTVVVGPASGKVLVKVKGSNRFEELDVTKGIPLGSEVDVRKGRVTLTAIGKRGASTDKAEFYDGMFVVTQRGGVTDLKLSEPLDCAKRSSARASQKKPKKRKLWGKGTGKFRTTGSYSAATVRGTTWLVQDTCTTTLTRVTQGVVAVRDNVKRKTILVKKGKRYTARQKRR
jgi:hypothetical protein